MKKTFFTTLIFGACLIFAYLMANIITPPKELTLSALPQLLLILFPIFCAFFFLLLMILRDTRQSLAVTVTALTILLVRFHLSLSWEIWIVLTLLGIGIMLKVTSSKNRFNRLPNKTFLKRLR